MPKTASALSASRKVDLPMLRAKQSSDSGEAFPGIHLPSEIWLENWAATCSPNVILKSGFEVDMATLR